MLVQILFVFLSLWMIISRWQRRKMIRLANQLKSRYRALPFIGHSYLFLGSDIDRMEILKKIGEQALEKGGIVSHWQGNRLFLIIADPEAAELVLKNCLEKDEVTRFFRNVIGNGSIFAPVSIWRPRRKTVAPTFSPKNLYHFMEIFSRQSGVMVNMLRKAVGSGPLSMWRYFTCYTMDSVCETTLGLSVEAQMSSDQPFLHAFEEVTRIDSARVFQPWLYNDTIYKMLPLYKEYTAYKDHIWQFVEEIIMKKCNELKNKDHTYNKTTCFHAFRLHGVAVLIFNKKSNGLPDADGLKTFLELLINTPNGTKELSTLELQEETMVLVLAGTDTTAVGASFATLLLSKYPEVQENVYQELQEVFGDSDRPVTAEDLPQLKYLEAVIKETLRLYPPVPFIVRKVGKDLPLPSGVTALEGCGVFISIWSIHRNRAYWGEDAEQFRPERFINTTLKHPAAFIPFSHGPRSCLGYQYGMMSMKTALASLLRQYRLKPVDDEDPKKTLRVKYDIMLRHVDNFAVQLESRI